MQRSGPLLLASFTATKPRRSHSIIATTRRFDPTALDNTLCVSFELGEGKSTLSFTSGFGEQVLRRSVTARDNGAVLRTIVHMRERLGLASDGRVVSCYEAGRDGFWLDRRPADTPIAPMRGRLIAETWTAWTPLPPHRQPHEAVQHLRREAEAEEAARRSQHPSFARAALQCAILASRLEADESVSLGKRTPRNRVQ